jgi:hypothetical protein
MLPTLIITILSAIAQYFLPWWVVAPIVFAVCFWQSDTAGKAFLSGTASVTLVWAAYAGFLNFQNQGVLAARMGELLFKSPNNPGILLTLTPLIGGLVGGISGLAGFYVRQLVSPRPAPQRV